MDKSSPFRDSTDQQFPKFSKKTFQQKLSKTIFKLLKNKIDNKTLGSGSKLGQNSGSGSKLGQNSGSGSKFCVLGSTTLLKVVKERLGSGPRAYDVSG